MAFSCGRLVFGWSEVPLTVPAPTRDADFAVTAVRHSHSAPSARSAGIALQLGANSESCCAALSQRNIPLRAALRHERRRLRRWNTRYLEERLLEEFWGGARGKPPLRRLLEVLRHQKRRTADRRREVFIDVGAAAYEGPDVSHALEIAQLWQCAKVQPLVLALEPLHGELRRTRAHVQRSLRQARKQKGADDCQTEAGSARAEIRWLQLAASNTSGRTIRMRGGRNQASISAHIPSRTGSSDYATTELHGMQGMLPSRAFIEEAITVRLDDLVQEQGVSSDRIRLLKLDTEGHDWEALLGAAGLLGQRLVEVVVFELAGTMNEDFFILHKEGRPDFATRRLLELRERPLAEPSLHSLVTWLAKHGYASLLLGQRRLIPLNGDWWDPSFEVCLAYPAVPCWYDVLAMRMDDKELLRHVLPAFKQ